MEKNKTIIIIIAGILLIGAVIGLLVADAKDDTVLTIGKSKYTAADFDNYCKTMIYDGIFTSSESQDNMYQQYLSYKVFNKWAESCGITVSGDEIGVEFESGDEEKLVNGYEISVEDYTKVKTEMAMANKLAADAYKLGKVPEDVEQYYLSYLNAYPTALDSAFSITLKSSETVLDYNKMVDYRVFEVTLPERESGDVVNGISGDELAAQDILDAKLKAQDALAQIKDMLSQGIDAETAFTSVSGDFEESTRYTATVDNQYAISSVSNSELTSISKLFAARTYKQSLAYLYGLESQLLYDNIVLAVQKAEEPGFSDIFTTDDSVGFVYVENVRDGLEDPDLAEFKALASTYYIYNSSDYILNKRAIKSFNYKELPGEVEKLTIEEDPTLNETIEDVGSTFDEVISGDDRTIDVTDIIDEVSGE